METYIFLFIVILLSATLQTSTGFGFSIMTVPLLLLIFNAQEAVIINNILSVLLSVLMLYQIRKEIDKSLLVRLITGSIFFMPLGLIVFLFVPEDQLKITTGIFILLFSFLLVFKVSFNPSNVKDRIVGGLSGFLSTAIGIPGPPLLAYSSAISMDKAKMRSTTLAFYIFIYSISAVLQLGFKSTSFTVWISTGLSIPFVIVGIFMGQWLFKKINQKLFRTICLGILFLTGIQLIYLSIY